MVVSCGTETGDGSKGSGALYVSGFDWSFPYIILGVASAFGPDHYILPHITQRIQAASAFQAGPHFISYPGAVPTLSHLQRITRLQDAGFVQHLYHCANPVYSRVIQFLATEVQCLANSGETTCVVLSSTDLEHHMGKTPVFFESVRWQPQQCCEVILRLELDKAEPTNSPLPADIDADHVMMQDAINWVSKRKGKKANKQPLL